MKDLPNIEKSGFRHGQYVGYGAGIVWRITKSNSSFGNWAARPQPTTPNGERMPTLFAMTLASMSDKLSQVKHGN